MIRDYLFINILTIIKKLHNFHEHCDFYFFVNI